MIRVKDENDNIINGLIKNDVGAIIVDDNTSYKKYIQSKKQLETINTLTKDMETTSKGLVSLKQDVDEIKFLLQTLINNSITK